MRRATDWLWGEESAAYCRFVQLGLAVILAARIALPPYRGFSGQPAALFHPPWILSWLSHMPSNGTIGVVQVCGVLGALAAIFGRGPVRRVGFVVAWLAMLFLGGLRDSRGKIMHNDLLLVWASFPFLFAPGDLSLRDRARSVRAGWPVRLSLLLVALIYFFAGYAKMVQSGPSWVFSDNMTWVMRWAADSPRAPFPSITYWVADHEWLTIAGAASIIAVELLFPLILPFRRLRPVMAFAAVGLHVSTALLLGYDYWAWAAVVPVVLIDWPAAWTRLVDRMPSEQGDPARPDDQRPPTTVPA